MIALLKENLKELLSFLKNPKDTSASSQQTSGKFRQLFAVLLIDMALVLVIVMPLMTLIEYTGLVDMENHAVSKLLESLPAWQILLIGGLLMPILEELIFRTFLTFRRNLPLRLLIALAGIAGARKKAKVNDFVQRKWRSYYRYTFYAVAILFAFVHITNFEMTAAVFLLVPLLVLPQFLAGLFLGYIRVKSGLVWAMSLHSIHNIILISISLWMMEQAVEMLNTKTEGYEIKIEESLQGKQRESSSRIGIRQVVLKNTRLEEIMQYLLYVDDKLLEIKNADKADLRLNIRFTSTSDTLIAREVIFRHLQEVYGLEVSRQNRQHSYLELQLADSLLLASHQNLLADTKEELQATFSTVEGRLLMENADLGMLVKNLNKSFEPYIVWEQTLAGKYHFDLPAKDVDELSAHLEQEYGLSLIRKEKDFEFVTVAF